MIQFVSLISRDDRPLYVQSFGLDDGPESANAFLKYNFLSHMALDVYSSPTSVSLREQQQQQGDESTAVLLLFIQDGTAVYGLEMNNGLKIIAGFAHVEGTTVSKVLVRDLFARVHKFYLRAVFNPFANGDEEALKNGVFDRNVREMVESFNKKEHAEQDPEELPDRD